MSDAALITPAFEPTTTSVADNLRDASPEGV